MMQREYNITGTEDNMESWFHELSNEMVFEYTVSTAIDEIGSHRSGNNTVAELL